MIKNLQEKLEFIEFVDKMKDIERAVFLGKERKENNAEHSFQLAIIVMTFSEDFFYLDIKKCLELALVHDIIEIYAGDTIIFDKEREKTKEKREKESLKKIKEKFKKILPNIIDLIEEYEKRETKESKFIYSLDKIQPIIQVVNRKWNDWKYYKMDLNKIKENKYSKIYKEFWLEKILDIYFEKAEKEQIWYFDK